MFFYILTGLFYLCLIWLSWKNIRWGIYLTLLFLPSYQIRFTIFGLPTTLLAGMIWLLFIIWLIKLKREKGLTFSPVIWWKNLITKPVSAQNLVPKQFRLPIVLLLVAATISIFVAPNLQSALGIWKAYFVEALLFFIVFVYNLTEPKHLKQVVRILGLLTIIMGIMAIYQKLTGQLIPNPYWAAEATRRVTTLFSYPNAGALLIAPIILLTLGNFLTNLRSSVFGYWSSVFNLLVIFLGILTIVWTGSSGAMIGLAGGFIFLLIFYKKTRLATLLILMLISGSLLFSPAVKNKLQNSYIAAAEIHLPDKVSDIQIRAQQWRETLKMLADRPILGAGLAGYQIIVAPYHQNRHLEIFLYPHNFFLNFWTETGLLGLLAIIWIIIVFFWSAIIGHRLLKSQRFKNDNHDQFTTPDLLTLTTSCAMITLLIHGLVDVPYFKNDLAILFWIIIGLMIILYNHSKVSVVMPAESVKKIL